ncbi:hypothetical protein MMC12_005652 [Toensbergia leucococca]|nr:hypothetical protein [Toensbergia leucococca]
MFFSDLANELVLQIFQSCPTVPDVLALAATCHHFRNILTPSQKLPVLYQAAEAQFGPLQDAIQLVTHNSSQAAHVPRPVPRSFALLTQIISVGHVANTWGQIYPFQKWKHDQAPSRRLLSSNEHYLLRRAIYRLWLYSSAFHTPRHTRLIRTQVPLVRERAELLRCWPTAHLAEMLDMHAIMRSVLRSHICPSNGTVARKHRARFPDGSSSHVLSNTHIHLNYPPLSSSALLFQTHFHSTNHGLFQWDQSRPSSKYHYHDAILAEGWGDEIHHYYVVEDMLKLDPGQILLLRDSGVGKGDFGVGSGSGGGVASKGVVEAFVRGLGEWFENNGETFQETVAWVIRERGGDGDEVKGEVEDGFEGVTRW